MVSLTEMFSLGSYEANLNVEDEKNIKTNIKLNMVFDPSGMPYNCHFGKDGQLIFDGTSILENVLKEEFKKKNMKISFPKSDEELKEYIKKNKESIKDYEKIKEYFKINEKDTENNKKRKRKNKKNI